MSISDEIKQEQNKADMLRRALEKLIQLYTDKSHFVYELLQNAEDANATTIKFIQKDNQLEVLHDGKPFTKKNLGSLCDIGISDKTEDLNQIGEFGIGFKSVFGICDRVKLFNYKNNYRKNPTSDMRNFAVQINDFTVPDDIDQEALQMPYTTKFILPYCVGLNYSGFKDVTLLKNAIMKRLINLGVSTLLFMKNLKMIEYEIDIQNNKRSGFYMLDSKPLSARCQLLTTIGETDKENESFSYLKFTHKVNPEDDDTRSVDIAFSVTIDKNGNYNFFKSKLPFISVYFPTETESKLDFIVQGPYRTTPNRSSVPSDDEDNIRLADLTAQLLYDSVIEIKNLGQLNLSLLNILPLDENKFENYDLFIPIFNKVVDLFINEGILPCKYGGYVKAQQAKIVRGQELADLVDDELLSKLINKKSPGISSNIVSYRWLTTEITETVKAYKELFEFLTNCLSIDVLRAENIKDYIIQNGLFLKERDTDWLIRFYNYLEKVPNLFSKDRWGASMLLVKFVKVQSGDFVAPYIKNEGTYFPNVFLPADFEVDGIKIIQNDIYLPCKKFFTDILNLTKPQAYDSYKQSFLKRYRGANLSVSDEQHIEDIKFLNKYLDSDYKDDCKKLLSILSLRCVENGLPKYINVTNNKIHFEITNEGVSSKIYYKGVKEICIVDVEFYDTYNISRKHLQQLGVVGEIAFGFSERGWYFGNGNSQNKDLGDFRSALSFNDVDDVLDYISKHPDESLSKKKSNIILQLLFKFEKYLSGTIVKGKTIRANENAVSTIINVLNGRPYGFPYPRPKWLYSKEGHLIYANKISKYDLDKNIYGAIRKDSEIYKLLEFSLSTKDECEETFNRILSQEDDVQDEILNELCLSRLNISLNDLRVYLPNSTLEIIDEEIFNPEEPETFTFPERKVVNFGKLKLRIADLWNHRIPVTREIKPRMERTSARPEETRTYLFDMYGHDNDSESIFCQKCCRYKKKIFIEANQIENNPKYEWDQMHLSLCVECCKEFISYRNDSKSHKEFLSSLEVASLEQDEPINIPFGSTNIYFTATHLAEIQEILRLQNSKEEVADTVVNTNADSSVSSTSDFESLTVEKIISHNKYGEGIVISISGKFAKVEFSNGYVCDLDVGMCITNNIIAILD